MFGPSFSPLYFCQMDKCCWNNRALSTSSLCRIPSENLLVLLPAAKKPSVIQKQVKGSSNCRLPGKDHQRRKVRWTCRPSTPPYTKVLVCEKKTDLFTSWPFSVAHRLPPKPPGVGKYQGNQAFCTVYFSQQRVGHCEATDQEKRIHGEVAIKNNLLAITF